MEERCILKRELYSDGVGKYNIDISKIENELLDDINFEQFMGYLDYLAYYEKMPDTLENPDVLDDFIRNYLENIQNNTEYLQEKSHSAIMHVGAGDPNNSTSVFEAVNVLQIPYQETS